MKKMLVGAFLGMFALAGIAVLPNVANAETTTNTGFKKSASAEIGGWDSQNVGYNASVAGSDDFQGDALLVTIKTGINWVLGILSFIALCLCLWGGFQMMTSGGDSKKYESGLNVLKWAAIGLGVIAVSWLVVSLIFLVINGAIGGSAAK